MPVEYSFASRKLCGQNTLILEAFFAQENPHRFSFLSRAMVKPDS